MKSILNYFYLNEILFKNILYIYIYLYVTFIIKSITNKHYIINLFIYIYQV
ncbi:hypothetical protein LY90DRAFT_148739 [Neocallimastix californiae]|uniref:Uncharacterized protein n=1 Tax=Neocallimastix californiae TaxID=1754190 RepID=A0A1Y2EV03_9FUNG|nr:hypothetical protein LY90DRAFT_148739 [Neocallimastix californiae]|eukprot:ORY74675.1 hypothetical protein LY90DRAFT_148739 [Neocallimastix californiae]